jgi:hypothetical protein
VTGAIVGAPSQAFRRRAIDRALRVGCLEPNDYGALHPDLAGVEPLGHFADFGIWEGRAAVAPERLSGLLAKAAIHAMANHPSAEDWEQAYRRCLTLPPPTLVLPPLPARRDLAVVEALKAALEEVGVPTRVSPEWPHGHDAPTIAVRPDQVLFQGARGEADFGRLARSVVVGHTAPDDAAFARDLPFILGAAGVISTCADTAALLGCAGTPSLWLRPPISGQAEPGPTAHPLYAGLGRAVKASPPRAPWAERPIDVLAIQPMTEGRKIAWRPLAIPLQAFRTIVYPPPPDAVDTPLEDALRRHLLDRSKIVINLHEDGAGAVPSTLAEEAALAGAALVSEPCRPHPLMRPGVHHLESSTRRMGALIEDLLTTTEGGERATKAIHRNRNLWISESDPEILGLSIVNLLMDAAERAE